MSAPAPFPRTPEPEQDDIRRYLPPPRDPTWTASWPSPTATGTTTFVPPRTPEPHDPTWPLAWPSPTAGGGTITPPSPAEPEAARHPADARLSDAENALMAARRNSVNALEWIDRALRDLRKVREGR